MKILTLEQGTKEWHDHRRCVITGTKLKMVMGTKDARNGLIAELIAEEATEQSKIISTTAEMERGNAEEIFAVRAFEERTGKKVARVGMCMDDTRDWIGLSPDGMIMTEGQHVAPGVDVVYEEAVEVKCPDSKKAILYRIENMVPMEETGLLSAKGLPLAGAPFLGVPSEYKWQVVHYFIVNKHLKKLYFLIYDARFIDEDAKLYVVEVLRENELLQEAIAEAEMELVRFRADWMKWREIVLPTVF